MPDSKITALTSISTSTDPANDPLVIVDVSDTSMAATGTTKKVTLNQLLGASGTATLASATITGDLTVKTNVLKVDTTNNRVGVGTATPSSALEVVGAASISGNTTSSGFIVSGASSVSGAGMWGLATALAFNVNSTEGMRLTSTGLGVGGSPVGGLLTIGSTGITSATSAALTWLTSKATLTITPDGATNGAGTTINYSWANGGQGPLIFRNASISNVMTLDASGNVGIAVTPSAWGGAYKALDLSTTAGLSNAGGTIDVTQNAYNNGTNWIYKTTAAASFQRQQSGIHYWFTAPSGTAGTAITFTQAMTLDASGRLFVGLTSSPYGTSRSWFSYDGGTVYGAGYKNITAGSGTAVVFVSSTNGLAGYISTTDTTVTYASVSDYRLKQDVKPLSGGLARVNALKPSIYKWKSDGSSAEGFIAHELAEVVPSAVIGSKDEVNEDGSIKAQGVDLSKVVPVLVAAIQELTARVQTLETR